MKLDTNKIMNRLYQIELQLNVLQKECCIAREELERFHAPTPLSGKKKRFIESAEKVLMNRNASMFKRKLKK